MKEFRDLIGERFGYLTVIDAREQGKIRRSWLCECKCGRKLVMRESHLVGTKNRRPNKSCGCMEETQKGYSMSHSKLFTVWNTMKARCYTKSFQAYKRYGAKGITVCDEWLDDFEPFLNWSIDNGYEEGLTIDRIDNSKGYSPLNCRWVTHFEQARNKGIRNNNKSGTTGVAYDKRGKYRAYITRNRIKKELGWYEDIEDAIQARKYAEDYYNKHGMLPN